jgi:hypothetical protein
MQSRRSAASAKWPSAFVSLASKNLKPEIAGVVRVARPAGILGVHYQQASQVIYQGINEILNGQDARSVLPGIASRLQRLLGT